MAVYKRKKGAKKYTIEIPDHLGTYRKFSGLSDRRQTEKIRERIVDLINYRGSELTKPLIKWLETSASPKLKARLADLDIIDARWAQSDKALRDIAEDFRAHMEYRERSRQHITETVNMINRLCKECGFKTFSDMDANKIEKHLKSRREDGLSVRRSNAYVVAIKSFCRWMVDTGKVTETPVSSLRKLNEKTDRKRERMAATPDELRALIAKTKQAGTLYGMTGPERALLYWFASATGLRANEARNLKVFDINLEDNTVVVQAGYSKHRETDIVPIRDDIAEALTFHLRGKLPSAKVFGGTYKALTKRTAHMLEQDLEAAEIPITDDQGRVFDFHALRHTYITSLSHAPSRVAQSLARHKSSAMTDKYTHIHLLDERAALRCCRI
jgi:integrase